MAAPSNAQLAVDVPRVFLCAYLDIAGDPVRAALAPMSIVTPGTSILSTADADFDNQTFTALDPTMVSVTPVTHGAGGMEAVEFRVSGTLADDADYLTALSNPALFRGRTAKLWMGVFDANWQPIAARPYAVGYMTTPKFLIAPDEQVITIVSENYMALVASGAPSRTLLWTPDPDDRAADATTGAVNSTGGFGPGFGGGGGGGLYMSQVNYL
jgi:hypothetical protein